MNCKLCNRETEVTVVVNFQTEQNGPVRTEQPCCKVCQRRIAMPITDHLEAYVVKLRCAFVELKEDCMLALEDYPL